ncbi:MAG: 2-deoxy-5-keto-D-gluconate 6-phosphate aldolase domain-containing protein, partial [Actinomycetota bacterium]
MALGYEGDLYILAFDHRGSFQKKMLGIQGTPAPEEAERISDAKAVIFEGFLRALDEGAPRADAGMLVDEQFGADLARRGRKEGVILAMPVEKSGQDEFDFEYGD